ncbi:MAG: hypothetical protein ACKOAD_07955, partial [Gammaproteobacteria bacterium]
MKLSEITTKISELQVEKEAFRKNRDSIQTLIDTANDDISIHIEKSTPELLGKLEKWKEHIASLNTKISEISTELGKLSILKAETIKAEDAAAKTAAEEAAKAAEDAKKAEEAAKAAEDAKKAEEAAKAAEDAKKA